MWTQKRNKVLHIYVRQIFELLFLYIFDMIKNEIITIINVFRFRLVKQIKKRNFID
jgi:hypothetical protein